MTQHYSLSDNVNYYIDDMLIIANYKEISSIYLADIRLVSIVSVD